MKRATAAVVQATLGARHYGGKGMRGDAGGKGMKGGDMYGKGMKGGPDMGMYGGKGMKGGPDMDMYGGKGMKGDMDMYGGKGMKGGDMYGKGMKGGPDMDMYGGKGMKGGDMYGKGMKGGPDMDMYGGKGMKGDMDMYGGKGMKGGDMYGKGMKGGPDMDMYGGKGMKGGPDMDMYGGKGMKGDMDMYGGKGMKGGDMYGKGMKGGPDMDMYGGKGMKGMPDMDMYGGGKGMKGAPPAAPTGQTISPASLKLDFAYPAGQVPELGMFDTREEMCRTMGFVHGQHIRVTNPQNAEESFEMVAIGVARDPESGEVVMWFHIGGEPGAGMFHNEMLDAYREFMQVVGTVDLKPLDAQEQKELQEHVKLSRRMQLNEINIDCFNAWRTSKNLIKMWQPKLSEEAAKSFPNCQFGYAMDTGDEELGAVFAQFDKSDSAIGNFTVQDGIKLQHGVTLSVPEKEGGNQDYVVIGCRPMPGVRYVLWCHNQANPGARPLSIRKLKKATLKNVPPQAVKEGEEKDFKETDPVPDNAELAQFERFIKRAERAVVRRVLPKKKGKKAAKKSETPAEPSAKSA